VEPLAIRHLSLSLVEGTNPLPEELPLVRLLLHLLAFRRLVHPAWDILEDTRHRQGNLSLEIRRLWDNGLAAWGLRRNGRLDL